MKLVHPILHNQIRLGEGIISSLIVENAGLYYELLKELKGQISDEEGQWVLSDEDTPLSISKNVEMITDIVDFNVNQKTILSKVLSALEKEAYDEEHIEDSLQLLSEIERYVLGLSERYHIELECDKISVQQLLKSVGISLVIEDDKLIELLYSYMELVREFLLDKLFVFVNLRCFVTSEDMKKFADTVTAHGFRVLLFDNQEYPMLEREQRIILDEDMCEI